MKLDFSRPILRKISLHLAAILGAVLLFSLWGYLGTPLGEEDAGQLPGGVWGFLKVFVQTTFGLCCFLLPPVYFSIYWLVPQTLLKKRYVLFVVVVVAALVVWGLFVGKMEVWTDAHWFGGSPSERSASDGIAVIFFIFLITILLNLSYRWFVQTARIQQLKNDQLHRELALLRNQINPHFFFNTLNNLYALALEQSEKTPEVILKLSEMMRYAIYECKEEEVPVASEIKYLENYIALQKIRLSEECDIRLVHSIDDPAAKIAPMVLIVFVENAFKHGLESMGKAGFIHVELTVKDRNIRFEVENNFESGDGGEPGGVGLENVRRRLSLTYPDRHELTLAVSGNRYRAALNIQI